MNPAAMTVETSARLSSACVSVTSSSNWLRISLGGICRQLSLRLLNMFRLEDEFRPIDQRCKSISPTETNKTIHLGVNEWERLCVTVCVGDCLS